MIPLHARRGAGLLVVSGLLVLASTRPASADELLESSDCGFAEAGAVGRMTIRGSSQKLIGLLSNPPRTRVTLSIDGSNNQHIELVWDPAVDAGLQQTVVLSAGTWYLSPSIESDRVQTGQVILDYTSTMTRESSSKSEVVFKTTTDARVATQGSSQIGVTPDLKNNAKLRLTCTESLVSMSGLRLDARRVANAQARGLLDQAVPKPVEETLSIVAEVALAKARSGAMRLIKKKFVEPMCNKLSLKNLKLDRTSDERAFPKTCALLEQLRLDDVLTSGRSLMTAVKDDVRITLIPALIDNATISSEGRDVARLALDLADRVLSGESNALMDVDVLITLLDRVRWTSGLDQYPSVVDSWIASLVPATDKDLTREIKLALLELGLPKDLGDRTDERWKGLDVCQKQFTSMNKMLKWVFRLDEVPSGAYFVPVRERCVKALYAKLDSQKTFEAWIKKGREEGYFTAANAALVVRSRLQASLAEWLETKPGQDALKTVVEEYVKTDAVAYGCTARLVVGIAKWCSGRETCSVADIQDVLDAPQNFFKKVVSADGKPDVTKPETFCWKVDDAGNATYRLPAMSNRRDFLDLATRLVSFLTQPVNGGERARAVALVHWTFDLVKAVDRRPSSLNRLAEIEGVVNSVLEHDYLRATAESLTLAIDLACAGGTDPNCEASASAKRALELLGAVGSYVQVYKDTEKADPAAAREARKLALESLIDAATDRTERGAQRVWSIGIPVGLTVGRQWIPGDEPMYVSIKDAYDSERNLAWRLPLGLSFQRLPHRRSWLGFHSCLWFADLGQFARTRSEGTDDPLRWKDFLGVGFQAGFLLGTSSDSVVLAGEASWSPGLYARDVTIDDGTTSSTERVSGAFRVGVTLAYYVPLFDLN